MTQLVEVVEHVPPPGVAVTRYVTPSPSPEGFVHDTVTALSPVVVVGFRTDCGIPIGVTVVVTAVLTPAAFAAVTDTV